MAAKKVLKKIELYYDVVSPYSWIGFEVLCRYKNIWPIDLVLKPFFLGGVMKASGNKPPGLNPNKAKYMGKDLERLRQFYGIPINFPENFAEAVFEKGSLQAQRFLTAVDMIDPQLVEPLSRQLWMRIWSRDEDITENESLLKAAQAAGLSKVVADDAVQSLREDRVKDRLKQYTAEAIELGAFGAPTIVVHKDKKRHLFFGNDRFDLIAWFIGETWDGPHSEMAKTSKL